MAYAPFWSMHELCAGLHAGGGKLRKVGDAKGAAVGGKAAQQVESAETLYGKRCAWGAWGSS